MAQTIWKVTPEIRWLTPLLVLVLTKCSFRDLWLCTCLFSGTSVSSMVMCADHPGLTFTLALVRTEPTYNQPMQQWSFVSDFAVSHAIRSVLLLQLSIHKPYKQQYCVCVTCRCVTTLGPTQWSWPPALHPQMQSSASLLSATQESLLRLIWTFASSRLAFISWQKSPGNI